MTAGPMILGIGSDLIDIRRIETHPGALRRPLHRPRLTRRSRAPKAERRADRAATYAKRYAAKEACAKALGTGFRDGVFWRDLGVVNLPWRPADAGADGRRRSRGSRKSRRRA